MKLLIALIAASQLWLPAAGNCKCVNDWTSAMRRKRDAFTTKIELGRYEYMGVFEGMNGAYYKECACDDVVRAQATLTVENAQLYEKSLSSNTTGDAEQNITDTLLGLKRTMEEDTSVRSELLYRIEKVYTSLSGKKAPRNVTFDIEVVLRGFNDTAQYLKTALTEATPNETLPFLGPYTCSDFTEVRCAGEPPTSPQGVGLNPREWSGISFPPAKAYYTCATALYAHPHGEGVSTCLHHNKTWTKLNPDLKCMEGCEEDPPAAPSESLSTWDNTTRSIDHVVNYTCRDGFSSGDGKGANSTCQEDGTWSKLPATYFCTELPCDDDIPQVPSHAVSNFDEEKRTAGTVVTYSCIPGFRSQNESDMTVRCERGNWTRPKPGWYCTNVHSLNLADILKGEMDIPDDELTDAEKQRKLAMATETYYFWIVTIPSIIGLALAMLLCLCCTRTDSPLFNLCGGRRKNAFGYEDRKYLGLN